MKLTRENVQPRRGSSFARLEFDLPEFDTHYHYHPEIEITWIVSSEGQRLIGDAIESFHPGDLALIGSNVPHQYRNWRRGRARSKVIQFRQDLFGPELLDDLLVMTLFHLHQTLMQFPDFGAHLDAKFCIQIG